MTLLRLAASIATLASVLSAQAEFEVASVKRNPTGERNMGALAQPGGRFVAHNVPLRFLIVAAYNVKDFQIVAGNSTWINTERYDIAAKAPEGTANGFEAMRVMLQTLLVDRFKLSLHRQTSELPVYELSAAKSGPKLAAPKDSTCGPPDPNNPRPRERVPLCDNIRMSRGLIEAYGVTMPRLAGILSNVMGRDVMDKTGFTSVFDARVEFAPDEAIADPIIGGRTGQPTQNDPAKPSIFTALQEQLGLRLESAKGAVETVIIDHAERPSEN